MTDKRGKILLRIEHNYLWAFFSSTMNNNKSKRFYTESKRILSEGIKKINAFLSENHPVFNVDLIYCDSQQKSQGISYCEQKISIRKNLGDYAYTLPFIRLLIGIDNILLYQEQLRIEEFLPNEKVIEELLSMDLFAHIIGPIRKHLEALLNEENHSLDLNNKQNQYIIFEGKHHCYLNCGRCCDGKDNTKLPLLGGQYCKALTNVGKICICYLKGLPPDHNICLNYECGLMQEPEWQSSYRYGCKLISFVPIYEKEELYEFIRMMNRILQIKLNYPYGNGFDCELPQSFNKTLGLNSELANIIQQSSRSREIGLYLEMTDILKSQLSELSRLKPKYYKIYEKIEFYIARNDLKNLKKIIEELLGMDIENLPIKSIKKCEYSVSIKSSEINHDDFIIPLKKILDSFLKWNFEYNRRIKRLHFIEC